MTLRVRVWPPPPHELVQVDHAVHGAELRISWSVKNWSYLPICSDAWPAPRSAKTSSVLIEGAVTREGVHEDNDRHDTEKEQNDETTATFSENFARG